MKDWILLKVKKLVLRKFWRLLSMMRRPSWRNYPIISPMFKVVPIYKLIHKSGILTRKTLTWQKTQTEDPFGGYEAGDLTKQYHAQCQLDKEAAAPSRGRRWWWTNLQW